VNTAIKITGINQLRRTIDRLPAELKKRAEVPVLRAGAKPINQAAKRKVNVGNEEFPGLLKKSLGIVVKKVKGIYSARIGARTGFKKSLGTKIARKTNGKKVKGQPYDAYKNPTQYSLMVEMGTRHSAPRPFIRPAVDSTKGEVLGAMAGGLEKHLHRTAKRLAKKASA
jgi:HK97 gp10 family phage protein